MQFHTFVWIVQENIHTCLVLKLTNSKERKMNADLLAMLGGAGLHGGGSSRREAEAKTILDFKAGKMSTTLQPVSIIIIKLYFHQKKITTIIIIST